MIKDNINNYKIYTDLDNKIITGLRYLADTDFAELSDGKHILSNDMYVNIQTYQTKSDADFEAHRQYIDIQYMISGAEQIGVTEYTSCSKKVAYAKDNDIEFLNGDGNYYLMNQGDFMILYPNDAHKPSISTNNISTVRKAVVKVLI